MLGIRLFGRSEYTRNILMLRSPVLVHCWNLMNINFLLTKFGIFVPSKEKHGTVTSNLHLGSQYCSNKLFLFLIKTWYIAKIHKSACMAKLIWRLSPSNQWNIVMVRSSPVGAEKLYYVFKMENREFRAALVVILKRYVLVKLFFKLNYMYSTWKTSLQMNNQKHQFAIWEKVYFRSKIRYWNVPILVNTGTFLVYQYCRKM